MKVGYQGTDVTWCVNYLNKHPPPLFDYLKQILQNLIDEGQQNWRGLSVFYNDSSGLLYSR